MCLRDETGEKHYGMREWSVAEGGDAVGSTSDSIVKDAVPGRQKPANRMQESGHFVLFIWMYYQSGPS